MNLFFLALIRLPYFCGDYRPPFCIGILILYLFFETLVLTHFQEAKNRWCRKLLLRIRFPGSVKARNEICPEIL